MLAAMTKKPTLSEAQYNAALKLKSLWLAKKDKYKEQGKRITQEDAAAELNFNTQGAFSHYINGAMGVNLEALIKFAKYFNVHPREISEEIAKPLGDLYIASTNSVPLKINSEQVERLRRASQFLLDHVGVKSMEVQGAEWTAETIALLYEVFHDPATEQLEPKTILRLIK